VRSLGRTITPLLVAAVVGSTAGTALSIAAPTAAFAESTYSMESEFVAKVNAARQANGQQPYALVSDLTSIARQHSADMARQQSLYHNPNLTTQVQNWQAVGENVGEGPTVDDIHQAFMNSPEHRDNILDHDFTQIGVGVSVDSNGIVWVTEDFREPMYTSSSSSHASSSHSSHSPSPSASSSSTGPSVSQGAPVSSSVSQLVRPRQQLSPRAALLQRLRDLRQRHGSTRRTDPVAQSFVYVANLSRLAG
jgi:hypothetical protein